MPSTSTSTPVDLSVFERLLTDISARFVNASATNVDGEITDTLRLLVEFLGIDRSTLFQWSADGRNLERTHHWVVAGCQPTPPFVAREALPHFLHKTLEGNAFSYSSLAELPPEAQADRRFLEKHGPKSNLSFPLRAGESILGALAFGTIRFEREWPAALRERLSVVAHVFANALERKRAELELRRAHEEVTQLKERLELDNQYLREELAADVGDDAIIAQSAVMKAVLREVKRVAVTDSTVLLSGDTGTGKELLAEAVHQASKRRDRLLVRVNCAALPGPLIESELFGREKGAYTGALTRESGRFEVADGGTLFLDEVGELRSSCRLNCCGFWRAARSSASAAAERSRSTSASWRPPIATWARPCARIGSARTCSSACRCFPFTFRRCATVVRTFHRSSGAS